jgi:hypothetical protein
MRAGTTLPGPTVARPRAMAGARPPTPPRVAAVDAATGGIVWFGHAQPVMTTSGMILRFPPADPPLLADDLRRAA